MAACIRQTILRFATFASDSQKLLQTSFAPRALFSYQQTRSARRTSKPPSSWREKKGGGFDESLTKDNKEFLRSVVHETAVTAFDASPLKDAPWPKGEWNQKTFRSGVLAIKVGVIPQWTKNGKKFFVTMLQVLDNHVIDYIPPEDMVERNPRLKKWSRNGKYGMCVVGALSCDPRMFTPQYNEFFQDAGVPPKRKITKFLVSPNAAIQPGTPLTAMHFRVGDHVDVQAKTVGQGFQGVMTRWGMSGGPGSHGATKFHRKKGSTGSGRKKTGLWKGTRMAGHMGMEWRTLKGLKVWRINTKYNILYVTGPCLPGSNHCYIRIYDTALPLKRRRWTAKNHPPSPTFDSSELKEPLPEEISDPELFDFKAPTIMYQPDK